MARKIKQGLSYFPHDCIFDDNLEYIIALYKETGYYVYFRLLEKIYFENGYYFEATKKNLILFSGKINVDIEQINVIINDCLGEHLFNKNIHKKYEILTSKGIQDRFFEAIKRRKEIDLIKEYILIDNVNNLLINVDINYQNVSKSTQSKVKESKVKKSKEFIKPTLQNVKDYFRENKYTEQLAIKFYNSYDVANWVDSKGNKILNWKQKAIQVWFKDDNKIKTELTPKLSI